MLGWFLYLAIVFSIGSFSLSVFIKKLWLVFIPKLRTVYKKFVKILANYLLLLMIFFLLSVMSFRSKFSYYLLLAFLVILTQKFLCLLYFILDS